MHDELDSMTWSGAFGENYTNNIITGLKKFFDKYQPTVDFFGLTCKADFTFSDNVCYDNIKGQIDSGKPAIGMTTTGNGYFSYDSNSDSWKKEDVALHMMIIYGYCTTSSGTIQDFITHSGWQYGGTEQMYVYKLNFIRNITFNYKVGAVV